MIEITKEELLRKIRDLEGEMLLVRDRSLIPIKVKVGVFACPASTGNYSVRGIGFKPRCVDFMAGWSGADYIRAGNGWMDYNGNQGSLSWGVTTGVSRSAKILATSCINVVAGDYTDVILASYISMNTDGFTINFSVTNSALYVLYKAVR